jgi:hypothetical protein
MKSRAIRAWIRAAMLVPAVFLLAVAAAGLMVVTGIGQRPSGDHSPGTSGGSESGPTASPSALTLPLQLPPGAGGASGDVTVRITTTPPVPAETLEASRAYLTGLLRSLVESLPSGWTPDAQGLAALQRAIEDAVPVSLSPLLPEGTQVTVDVTFAAPPPPPATPVSP